MKALSLAGLTVRLAGGEDGDGSGDGPLVVLLHGFGAPGDDLAPLWRVFEAPPGTRWAFPAAPLALPASMGIVGGRAWWLFDMERRLRAEERGELELLSREAPAGMDEARATTLRLLDALDETLRPSRVVLGGFSQGAMVSCDVALRGDRRLAGLLVFSGTLVAADAWAEAGAKLDRLPVFQSHGMADPVLPFAYAEKLRAALTAAGGDVTWVPFHGGHQIPDRVIRDSSAWLRAALGVF
jgi:phospholipase/carboxylesterase